METKYLSVHPGRRYFCPHLWSDEKSEQSSSTITFNKCFSESLEDVSFLFIQMFIHLFPKDIEKGDSNNTLKKKKKG